MAPKRDVDLGRWLYAQRLSPEGEMTVVQLEDGTLFPKRLEVFGRYASGPLLTLIFEVEDGRPVLRSLTIGSENDEDGAPITPSVIHGLPLGALIEETKARSAVGTLASVRAFEAQGAGRPHVFLTPAEVAQVRQAASVSQRGRPVSQETLRRVAEIYRSVGRYGGRAAVVEEFLVGVRTASRWIAEARERGFLDEEVGNDGNT